MPPYIRTHLYSYGVRRLKTDEARFEVLVDAGAVENSRLADPELRAQDSPGDKCAVCVQLLCTSKSKGC